MTAGPQPNQPGPWDPHANAALRERDQGWAEQCFRMSIDPWTRGILPRKTVELVALAWCSACTNLDAAGTVGNGDLPLFRAARLAGQPGVAKMDTPGWTRD